LVEWACLVVAVFVSVVWRCDVLAWVEQSRRLRSRLEVTSR
jgi:hypothetical protein